MKTNIDTIREALEMASKFFKSFMDCPREGQINEALAALSTIDHDAMLFEEIKSLLIDDSVCNLLRYGYKSPSNFVDDDDCASLHRLYDISNELFQRKEGLE